MRRVVVLGGPTAAGKTDTSIALAALIDCQVICADARQVFRRLDIGTAKPPASQRALVPHHLFDVLDPQDSINAAEYGQLVRGVIRAMPQKLIPLMVGGSGLYINAALDGLSPAIEEVDQDIRQQLQDELAERGRDALYEELERVDPQAAALYTDRNPRRVTRALEVYRSTGRPISEHWKSQPLAEEYETLRVGITCDRDELKHRIRLRCESMWSAGLLEEVEQLLRSGVSPQAQSMQSVGYRESVAVLLGTLTQSQARERLVTATWQYAKRQLTWFTRDLRYTWLTSDPESNAQAVRSMLLERKWIDD